MVIKYLKPNEVLHFLAGINRPICISHVTTISESIEKMGCLRPIIVANMSFINGKKQMYIIDGQHLFNALIRLNIPIPYLVIEVSNIVDLIEKIALLNASSKSWRLSNYVDSWSAVYEDYKLLNHYYAVYDFELGTLASILSNSVLSKSTGGSTSISKMIKSGEFKIVEKDNGIKILNNLTDIFKIIKRLNRQENKFVCTEYVNFYRNNQHKYNHTKFLNNLRKNKDNFTLATHEETKLVNMFESLL